MVEITRGVYGSGMPTMDYSIDINGIRISLKKEDFHELVEKLGSTLHEDYLKATQVKNKNDNNVKKIQEIRKDLVSIFWDDIDICFLKREVKDIEQEKLWDTLNKYDKFLGFE